MPNGMGELAAEIVSLRHSHDRLVQTLHNWNGANDANTAILKKIWQAVDPDRPRSESEIEKLLAAIVGRLDQIEATLGHLADALAAARG